jgi:serine/threonine protein kinase
MEGRSVCDQCSAKEHIRIDEDTGMLDGRKCLGCPLFGVTCNGIDKTYNGGVWHDTSITNPDASTLMYTCVTDGCPEAGSTNMTCAKGYGGPLCAICDEGYFVQIRKCTPCQDPEWGYFVVFVIVAVALVFLTARLVRRYKRYLDATQAFAHFKIFVSFVTVMSTVSTQFGVVWPTAFARALDALSMLSLDFGVLAGFFCFTNMTFYQSLHVSTLMLFASICLILSVPSFVSNCKARCVFAAVYLALFAYPVVSIKVIMLFGCHEIDYANGAVVVQSSENISTANVASLATKTFLRADYSLECYTPEWNAMSVYASLWIVLYVFAFPLYVIQQLLTCYYKTTNKRQDPSKPDTAAILCFSKRTLHKILRRCCDLSDPKKKPMLSFLADDYKQGLPTMLWEAEELFRKLLLSVIGAFWSTTSTMCLATAVLISVTFQLLHTAYSPYKSHGLNRLQQLSLTVSSLTYFIGVLLKTQSLAPEDDGNVGALLVLLLLTVVGALVAAIVLEVQGLQKWRKEVALTKRQTLTDVEFDPEIQQHVIEYSLLTLGKEIGRGAEGVVRKGTYDGNGVAVKVATLTMLGSIPMIKMLSLAMSEAKLMLSLRHPNVVQMYGVSVNYADIAVEVCTILELCQCSLQEHLTPPNAQLGWTAKAELCKGVAAGMAYIHGQGIIHRDLKVGNVLITKDGTPKIADFGLSKLQEVQGESNGVPASDRDAAVREDEHTSNVGTPVYMAPELMSDDLGTLTYGPQVDVYAFGVLMYVVLSGGRPYTALVKSQGLTVWGLRDHILQGHRPDVDIKSLRSAPSKLVGLMKKCWSQKPEDRPNDFKEIVAILNSEKHWASEERPSSSPPAKMSIAQVRAAKKQAAAKARQAAASVYIQRASGVQRASRAAGVRTSLRSNAAAGTPIVDEWEGATQKRIGDEAIPVMQNPAFHLKNPMTRGTLRQDEDGAGGVAVL